MQYKHRKTCCRPTVRVRKVKTTNSNHSHYIKSPVFLGKFSVNGQFFVVQLNYKYTVIASIFKSRRQNGEHL